MRIHLISAMANNRVIGSNNQLPWHLPDDLKHFKRLTQSQTMIMGRKTFDSLPGQLPGRPHWIISRHIDHAPPRTNVRWFSSAEASLACANDMGLSDVFIIGGGEIYRLFLPLATDIHLTTVECEIEGDTTFPVFNSTQWRSITQQAHPIDDQHRFSFIYRHYIRD